MSNQVHQSGPIRNRYDFVYLFDCRDGNPNGDPDFENRPRSDPETLEGLVSDVCLKRKIRNYVLLAKSEGGAVEHGFDILVQSGKTLESRQRMPYEDLGLTQNTGDPNQIEQARRWICERFFDVRTFGAVMATTDFNCGQVRGPVQLTFARSLDRIRTIEHTITRVTFTRESKAKRQRGGAGTEIGRKYAVAYALYRAYGFITPAFALETGFSTSDLQVLWQALLHMFEVDRSAERGYMSCRGLYVFKHDSALGCAAAHKLFDRLVISKRDKAEPPACFADYQVSFGQEDLPSGIEAQQFS